jgi:RNA polymerase sigma-70 factor (ECF subfamily)
VIDASRGPARRRGEPRQDRPGALLAGSADAAGEGLARGGPPSGLTLLARLPRSQAEVILLRVLAGLDTDAVARLLGRSPGAVRVAGHRGLRRLAEILAEAGVTL